MFPPFEGKLWWRMYSDCFSCLQLAIRRDEPALGWARKLHLHLETFLPDLQLRIRYLEDRSNQRLQKRRLVALVVTCICVVWIGIDVVTTSRNSDSFRIIQYPIIASILLLLSGVSWANIYTYSARMDRKMQAARDLLFQAGTMLDSMKECSETGDTKKVVHLTGLNQEQFDTVYAAHD